MAEQQDHTDALRTLIEGQRFVMLTTSTVDGSKLVSRPMTIQELVGWDARFITQASNDAAEQSDGRAVNLSFMDGNTYVSLAGTGSVERDPAKKRELWSKLNEAFAGEVDDPNNVVLTVTIASGEYWDGGNSVAQAIRVAKAAVTGERPDGGAHGTVEV